MSRAKRDSHRAEPLPEGQRRRALATALWPATRNCGGCGRSAASIRRVARQIKYEWDYLYGALALTGGEAHFAQVPGVSLDWDEVHLRDLAASDAQEGMKGPSTALREASASPRIG